ncbi:MAG: hypothetical protein QOH60_4439 [Mycobacterium sp.]|nr:hypothetical protein [Mycobacterium sp.]
MRSASAVSLWLTATFALLVAIPLNWVQHTLINVDGYTSMARVAGHQSGVQKATAALLTEQVSAAARQNGFSGGDNAIQQAATTYTASSVFPDNFADVNRIAHEWLFTNKARQTDRGWEIDLGPMLADTSFKTQLASQGVTLPPTVTVPVTGDTANKFAPGQLSTLATWGPWGAIGSALVVGVAAVLMLVVAKSRGIALAALGVSALLAGGVGWVALSLGRGRVDSALSKTNGNVQTIANSLLVQAEDSLQQWMTYALIAGGVLVVVGVLVAVLGKSMRRKSAPAYPAMQPQGYPPVQGYPPTRPPMEPTQPPSV